MKKEAMHFKENREEYIGELEEKSGKGKCCN